VVEASDGGQVTVHLIQDLQITSAFVEFIAHVNPDLTVRELTSIGLGDNFGTNAPCRSRILTALFFCLVQTWETTTSSSCWLRSCPRSLRERWRKPV